MAVGYRTDGAELTITVDSVDFKAEVGNVVIAPQEADNDFTTFADVAAGGTFEWHMTGTAIVNYQSGSFWRLLWEETGNTVAYILKPYAATVGADSPEFTGSIKVGAKPPIGGEAGSTMTFDFDLVLTGEPAMDVTA